MTYYLADAGGDFGTSLPSWVQLSAVAVLIVLMAVAIRVAYRFSQGAYQREAARADACETELRKVNAEHAAELRRVNEAHAAELRAMHLEMLGKEMPVLNDVARVLGDMVRLQQERR